MEFRESELQLLCNQGHCNSNYLLQRDGKKYHIRKFGLANMDREFEFKVQKSANKIGIAPKPIRLSKTFMIAEFIDGEHKIKLSKRELISLAKAVKRLHSIKIRKKPVKFSRKARMLSRAFKKDLVLSHGDLNVKNIIFSKTIKLIDWEYAGVMDRYFDIATICLEFRLKHRQERLFFNSYGIKIDKKKLKNYKKIYQILYKEWFKKLKSGKLIFLKSHLADPKGSDLTKLK